MYLPQCALAVLYISERGGWVEYCPLSWCNSRVRLSKHEKLVNIHCFVSVCLSLFPRIFLLSDQGQPHYL